MSMGLRFRYRFEAAHRLMESPNSACATPHGHTWYATLELKANSAKLNEQSMVLDFSQLKKDWKLFIDQTVDHSFMVNEKDPLIESLLEIHPHSRLLTFSGDPTTELIALSFFSKCVAMVEQGDLKELVSVQSILIEETPTNSISCDRNFFNEAVSQLGTKSRWWNSPDPLTR